MEFFIIIHVVLGALAANAGVVLRRAKRDPGSAPLWVYSPLSFLAEKVCFLVALLAIPTTFFEYGIQWTMATIVELFVGAAVAGFIPTAISLIIHFLGPFIAIYILGALWGFWFIPI